MIAWNHRAVLHRPPAGGMDANGFPTSVAWSQPTTPSGLNAWPDQSWSGLLADSPLGEVQAATHIWYLHAGFDGVEERDILDVVTGPMAPNRYKVHSVTKPTGRSQAVHHVEVATRIYEGAIT